MQNLNAYEECLWIRHQGWCNNYACWYWVRWRFRLSYFSPVILKFLHSVLFNRQFPVVVGFCLSPHNYRKIWKHMKNICEYHATDVTSKLIGTEWDEGVVWVRSWPKCNIHIKNCIPGVTPWEITLFALLAINYFKIESGVLDQSLLRTWILFKSIGFFFYAFYFFKSDNL